MRYMAIDYGLKRVGLALCDPAGTIVSPLCQLQNHPDQPDRLIEQLAQTIKENQVDALIVGLPINNDGTVGPQAQLCRQFADRLARDVTIPVHLQDERLSSFAADELLASVKLTKAQTKRRRDMLAACDILRSFLDRLEHV